MALFSSEKLNLMGDKKDDMRFFKYNGLKKSLEI